jgi:hypothetical protein
VQATTAANPIFEGLDSRGQQQGVSRSDVSEEQDGARGLADPDNGSSLAQFGQPEVPGYAAGAGHAAGWLAEAARCTWITKRATERLGGRNTSCSHSGQQLVRTQH